MKSNAGNGEDRLKWRYQDKEYNESYKKWRKNNKDAAGFYFDESPDRLTYRDGFGFIKDSAEAHEAKALKQVLKALGTLLLIRSFFDAFATYLLPYIIRFLGADISYDIFINKLYGSEFLIITETFVTSVLSVMLPAVFIKIYFKLPLKVIMPMKIVNKPMFRASVPFAVLISSVCCSMLIIFAAMFRTTLNSPLPPIPDSPGMLAYLVLTHVIIIPAISELCSGGAVMQLLRQFGDDFALFVTSFITAAFSYDPMQFLFYFTAAVSIRYFTIRSGSLLTGVIMRLTLSVYSFILCYINFSMDVSDRRPFIMAYMLVTLLIGIVFAIRFLYLRSDCFGLAIRSRFMPFGKKLRYVLTSIPIILWISLALIMVMLRAVFAK